MLFTSGKYGLFLAIAFFAYWLLASKRRVPVIFLLAVSYYFYALWNPKFLVLLVLISASDFLIALAIKATESKRRRKILLAASLVVDIGVLVTFK